MCVHMDILVYDTVSDSEDYVWIIAELTYLSDARKIAMGHTLEDLVLYCSFNGENCNGKITLAQVSSSRGEW